MKNFVLEYELKKIIKLLGEKEYLMVIKECQELLEQIPVQPDILNLLSIAFASVNDFDLAFQYFDRAINSAPHRSDLWGNYANACLECGKIQRAFDLIERSIYLDAEAPDPHNIKGKIFMAQSRFFDAEIEFKKALSFRPKFPEAQNNLGNALLKIGRKKEAILEYENLLHSNPDYADAWCNLGSAYVEMKDFNKANDCYERSLKLNPNHKTAKNGQMETSPIWFDSLESKRLKIRRQGVLDANYLSTCFSDNNFLNKYNRYIPRFRHPDILMNQLKENEMTHPVQVGSVDWVVFKKPSMKPIGLAGLTDLSLRNGRAEFLIGIPFESDSVYGIGLEASLLILDFSFNTVKLNKITSLVYGDNQDAQKNTLELGFKQEALFRDHLTDPVTLELKDVLAYGMLASEFRLNNRIRHLSKRLLGFDITKPQIPVGHKVFDQG